MSLQIMFRIILQLYFSTLVYSVQYLFNVPAPCSYLIVCRRLKCHSSILALFSITFCSQVVVFYIVLLSTWFLHRTFKCLVSTS